MPMFFYFANRDIGGVYLSTMRGSSGGGLQMDVSRGEGRIVRGSMIARCRIEGSMT